MPPPRAQQQRRLLLRMFAVTAAVAAASCVCATGVGRGVGNGIDRVVSDALARMGERKRFYLTIPFCAGVFNAATNRLAVLM